MLNQDDFYSRLIKPFRDKKITEIIDSADSSIVSPWDKDLSWLERIGPIKELRTNFQEWSKDYIFGIEKFPHMYIMNGNTDSLNVIFNNSKGTMSWQEGDYSYYKFYHQQINKPFNALTEPEEVDDFIVTWPGYTWGNKDQLNFANKCNPKRKHLDCAYLGLTNPQNIDVSDFETVSVSFSKTLAIPFNRIGILFSKTPISSLELLNKLGYVNLSGVRLVNHILKNLEINYWWNTYGEKLKDLCSKNNLRATDCLLFGYSDNKRISLAPYWRNYL
jgi:hypothetical protein